MHVVRKPVGINFAILIIQKLRVKNLVTRFLMRNLTLKQEFFLLNNSLNVIKLTIGGVDL